ncbi:MAG: hypothetical protein KGL15_03955 [Acidobacteriota bacterium]|nr:hypothetical protein [Acidobacteriota bacterium]
MTVEVLYFEGCPNHEALVPHLEQLLRAAELPVAIVLRKVADGDEAQRERFLGSPTVRVDGRDVDPGAGQRDDFGLKCRLYRVPSGLRGTPLDEWVLNALARART